MQSNSRAYVDKVDSLQSDLQHAQDHIENLTKDGGSLSEELHMQKEENTVLKGKIANLLRDLDLTQ